MTEPLAITGADLTILNTARGILKRIGGTCPMTYGGGRVAERAAAADDAVFETLSAAKHFLDADVSDDALHQRGMYAQAASSPEARS